MKFSKYFSVILILLIIAAVNNIHSQSEWVLKSTGCNLRAVFFYNEMIGWVVGDSGTILATADGGANWQCLKSGTSQSLRSVFFINDLTGWAAGTGGAVIKTINGGNNWSLLSSGTTSNINTIYFPTADTGYYSGDFPLGTKRTTDGGSGWTGAGPAYGSDLYFSSGLVGVATEYSSYLSRTINGGSSWTTNTAPGNPVNRYSISFINSSTGWTSGSGNLVYKTSNSGVNWTIQTSPATIFSTFYGIDFTDDLTGYMVGSTGQILKTSNGGTNWSFQTSGTTNLLRGVDFTTELTGWAVGDLGIILKTSDGGSTWQKQLIQYSSPFTQLHWLFDVQFMNEMTGWTCGMDGYVNKTTDGGNNWITISTASFNYLYSIYFPQDNDTGWACGRLGTIQKTDNGGINWSMQVTGTSQHLNSIMIEKSGVTNFNGFCAGDNGTILSTDTAGFNWSSQSSGTTNNLNSVFIIDDLKSIIAGDAGTILKTTDAGVNWVAKSSGTTENLKSIYFLNSSTGYVCGSNGEIRISADGGETWSAQSSGTTSTLNSIDFEEAMEGNGYAVGENGVILETTNGGTTWVNQPSGSTTTLYSVFAKDLPVSSPLGLVVRYVGKLARFGLKKLVTALPVELALFSYSVSNNNVTLFWQTSGEINNRGFEIERTSNSNVNWNKIGFTEGRGTTNESQSYTFSDRNLNSGIYKYRLKQLDYNGNYEYLNLNQDVTVDLLQTFELMQNYPNPFNPVTKINYNIPQKEFISLKIYNLSGKEIKTIVNEVLDAGYYSITFDGSDLSSGIYFYKLQSGAKQETKKMMLIK